MTQFPTTNSDLPINLVFTPIDFPTQGLFLNLQANEMYCPAVYCDTCPLYLADMDKYRCLDEALKFIPQSYIDQHPEFFL